MKTLKEYINESLLDDFDAMSSASTTDIRKEIKQFLKDNYKKSSNFKISKKPNNDGYYEVDCSKCSDIEVGNKNITSLTNNLFIFVNIKGDFDCSYCRNLTSLKGAPEEVDGDFYCSYNQKLTSLKGAPKEVKGFFSCSHCNNLTSLKGAPKKIKLTFNCNYCSNLKSLEGAPEEVGEDFYCNDCSNLTSLEGAPKEINYVFDLTNCINIKSLKGAPKKVRTWYSLGNVQSFDEYDIKKVCSVTKIIT